MSLTRILIFFLSFTGVGGGLHVPTGSAVVMTAKHLFSGNKAKEGGGIGFFSNLYTGDLGEGNCVSVRVKTGNIKFNVNHFSVYTEPSSQLMHNPLDETLEDVSTDFEDFKKGGLLNAEKLFCMPCGRYRVSVTATNKDDGPSNFGEDKDGDGDLDSFLEVRLNRPGALLVTSVKLNTIFTNQVSNFYLELEIMFVFF